LPHARKEKGSRAHTRQMGASKCGGGRGKMKRRSQRRNVLLLVIRGGGRKEIVRITSDVNPNLATGKT